MAAGVGGGKPPRGGTAGPGDVLLETTSRTKALKGRDLLETDKDITWKHFRRGRQKGWRENGKCPPPPPSGAIRAAPGASRAGALPTATLLRRCAPGL